MSFGGKFQCPPSRAGSCGNIIDGRDDITWAIGFQCPPSRAGSCGQSWKNLSRSSKLSSFSALHRGQGPAGRAPRRWGSIRAPRRSCCFSALHRGQGPAGHHQQASQCRAVNEFQCPPSRAGSCGKTMGISRTAISTSFSALHRGQGPAGRELERWESTSETAVSVPSIAGRVLRDRIDFRAVDIIMEFQCPPSRAGSCGFVTVYDYPLTGDITSFSALHRGQGPAGRQRFRG